MSADTPDMRNWMMLASRALNDAAAVIDTIHPSNHEEGERLSELLHRLSDLAGHVPVLLRVPVK